MVNLPVKVVVEHNWVEILKLVRMVDNTNGIKSKCKQQTHWKCQMITLMWNYLIENKEWIFSGIGVLILSVRINYFSKIFTLWKLKFGTSG